MTDLIDSQAIWNLRPEWIPGQVDNTRDNIIKIDVKIFLRDANGNMLKRIECDKVRFPRIERGALVLFSAKLVQTTANSLSDKDPDLVSRWQVDIDELREVRQDRDREDYHKIIQGFDKSHAARLDALVGDAEAKIEEQATTRAEEKMRPEHASLARKWQEHAADRARYREDRNSLKVAFSALATEQAYWDKEQQQIQNVRQELENARQKLEEHEIAFKQAGGKELLDLLRPSENTSEEKLEAAEDKEPPAQLVAELKQHFNKQNYSVENVLLLQTMLCLCVGVATGQFIVLTGPPGSGKTSLVQRIADALGAKNGVVPVRPAWIDATDLIGFYNPGIDRYQPTPFLDNILRAKRHSEKNRLFLLVLDEMNLGRVENYAADFLSLMEKAREDDKNAKIQLYSHELESRLRAKLAELPPDSSAERAELINHLKKYPSSLPFPTGLVLFGTINIDETTHQPSPKFLDRSLVIQVIGTELPKELTSFDRKQAEENFSWALSLGLAQQCRDAGRELTPEAQKTWRTLIDWQEYFKPLGIRLSHRLPHVYRCYMGAASVLKIADHQKVADTFVLSKIMPLISFRREEMSELSSGETKLAVLERWRNVVEKKDFPKVYDALTAIASCPGVIVRYLE